MKFQTFKLVLWLIVLTAAVGAQAVDIKSININETAGKTRLTMTLTGPVKHEMFDLQNPNRVVIDLKSARFPSDQFPKPAGFVKKIRTGQPDKNTLRVVLDLNSALKMRSFLRTPEEGSEHQLVVELSNDKEVTVVKSADRIRHGRNIVVAIDPGHGGVDPGAIGKTGTKEKDVVLAIAKKLKARIDREPGFTAHLIRAGDQFLLHRDRMRIAREKRADIFVSIHADAFKDARAHGSTVYVLSERGASSEAARWLAERENAADLMGGVSLGDKDDMLASVLLDLSQTASLSASIEAGNKVAAHLGKAGRVRRNKVQHAGFLVLMSPDIPSILVETAFISNPAEEKRLRSSEHQGKWADAIAEGLVKYFHENPPAGTLVAENQRFSQPQSISYTILRGDTLSDIAERFNVRLRSLRKANNIRGDQISVGQVIRIPASSDG